MKHFIPLVASCFLVCFLASGCRSTSELESQLLPFHVAVIASTTDGRSSATELPGTLTEMKLAFESDPLGTALAKSLREYCFERVSEFHLDGSAGVTYPAEGDESWSSLLERARDERVDMLLEVKLRYGEQVNRATNGSAWLNYPLFLFAGPSHWFVPDQTYYGDVEVTVGIYDVEALIAGDPALGLSSGKVLEASARFDELKLDFIDRAEGFGDYALGLLIPSVHLSRQTARTARELHTRILDLLRDQITRGVLTRRWRIVTAPELAPHFIDPEDVSIAWKDGRLEIEGTVHLLRDGPADRIVAVEFDGGAGGSEADLREQPAGTLTGYSSIYFSKSLRVAPGVEFLSIRCIAGSRDRFVRTYSFRIPAH